MDMRKAASAEVFTNVRGGPWGRGDTLNGLWLAIDKVFTKPCNFTAWAMRSVTCSKDR